MATSSATSGWAWTMNSLTSPAPIGHTSIPEVSYVVAGIDLPPVQWRAPPPTFVLATKDLFAWQPVGSPAIGALWYGPWRGPWPIDFFETLADQIVPLGEAIVTNLVRLNLPDRVLLAMAG